MAANYWLSTQAKTIVELAASGHVRDPDRALTEEQARLLHIFIVQHVLRPLGKSLQLRQRVIATAAVYFKRYYWRVGFSGHGREGEPMKIAPACLYLATKTEECNTLVKKIHMQMDVLVNQLGKPFAPYPHKLEDLMDAEYEVLNAMEFKLMSEMICRLQDNGEADLGDAEVRTAVWSAMNDIYLTDAPLNYPPHVLALGAILVGAQYFRGHDMRPWLATVIGPEMRDIHAVAQMLLETYELMAAGNVVDAVKKDVYPQLLAGQR